MLITVGGYSYCEFLVSVVFKASQAERLQVDTEKIKKKKGKTKSLLPSSEKVCTRQFKFYLNWIFLYVI